MLQKVYKTITYMLDRLMVSLILRGPPGPPILVVGMAIFSKPRGTELAS